MNKVSLENYLGITRGRLTISEFSHMDENNDPWFKCTCVCDKVVILRGIDVRRNQHRSCGCNTPYGDLTGKRYGSLVFLHQVGQPRSSIYRAQCDCGNQMNVTSARVRDGYIQSCGCKRHTGDERGESLDSYIDFTGYRNVIKNHVEGLILKALRISNKIPMSSFYVHDIDMSLYLKCELGETSLSDKVLKPLLPKLGTDLDTFRKNVAYYYDEVEACVLEIGMEARMSMDDLVKKTLLNIVKAK